jgi:hypothetical protein
MVGIPYRIFTHENRRNANYTHGSIWVYGYLWNAEFDHCFLGASHVTDPQPYFARFGAWGATGETPDHQKCNASGLYSSLSYEG